MVYTGPDFLSIFTSIKLHRRSSWRDRKKQTEWEGKEELLLHSYYTKFYKRRGTILSTRSGLDFSVGPASGQLQDSEHAAPFLRQLLQFQSLLGNRENKQTKELKRNQPTKKKKEKNPKTPPKLKNLLNPGTKPEPATYGEGGGGREGKGEKGGRNKKKIVGTKLLT